MIKCGSIFCEKMIKLIKKGHPKLSLAGGAPAKGSPSAAADVPPASFLITVATIWDAPDKKLFIIYRVEILLLPVRLLFITKEKFKSDENM